MNTRAKCEAVSNNTQEINLRGQLRENAAWAVYLGGIERHSLEATYTDWVERFTLRTNASHSTKWQV